MKDDTLPPTGLPEISDLLRHRSWVRGLAQVLLYGDEHLAQDVEQATWMAYLESPPVRPQALRSWLSRTVRNVAATTRRADRNRRLREEASSRSEVDASSVDVVERMECHEKLVGAILSLAEPYRSTILLGFYDGFSTAEIARNQETTADNVRMRKMRALSQLRTKLQGDAKDQAEDWRAALLPLALVNSLGGSVAPHATRVAVARELVLSVMTIHAKLSIGAIALAIVCFVLVQNFPTDEDGSTDVAIESGIDSGEEANTESVAATRAEAVTEPDVEPVAHEPDRDLDLFGRVTDQQGKPIPGAFLSTWTRYGFATLSRDMQEASERVDGPSTTSAEDGTFRLRLERDSNVTLHVHAERYGASVVGQCRAGEEVNIVLQEPSILTVIAAHEDGSPAVGHLIRNGFLSSFSTQGETDGRGRCVLPPTQPGDSMLRATLGSVETYNEQLTFKPGEQAAEIVVARPRVVRGRVLDRDTDLPIHGAAISGDHALRDSVESDRGGEFEITISSLSYGRVSFLADLHVIAEGYAMEAVTIQGNNAAEIRLGKSTELGGRVIGADGEPAVGCEVLAFASEHGNVHRPGFAEIPMVHTDQQGRFRFDSLRRGKRYSVLAQRQGEKSHPVIVEAQPVDTGGSRIVEDLQLLRTGVIRGVATDGEKRPLIRKRLSLDALEEYYVAFFLGKSMTTDDLGRFSIADVAPGSYMVTLRERGYPEASESVVLSAGEVLEGVRLERPTGSSLSLQFVDARGEALSKVHFELMLEGGTFLRATADEEGKASFHGLEDGVATIGFRSGAFSVPDRKIVIPDEKVVVIELRAMARTEWAALEGDVVDEAGEPLRGIMVFFQAEGHLTAGWAPFVRPTDAAGHFYLQRPVGQSGRLSIRGKRIAPANDLPGRISFEATGYISDDVSVTVPQRGIRLVARKRVLESTLRVVVLDENDKPIPDVLVALNCDHGPMLSQRSDEAGRAQFAKLPDDSVRIFINRGGPRSGNFPQNVIRKLVSVKKHEVVIKFHEGTMIHGRVVDRVGNSVRGAHLQGFSSDGQSTWSSEKSNAFGEFQIYLARGAKYKIKAIYTDKGGVRTWAEQVDVTTESTDLRLRLDVVIRE